MEAEDEGEGRWACRGGGGGSSVLPNVIKAMKL